MLLRFCFVVLLATSLSACGRGQQPPHMPAPSVGIVVIKTQRITLPAELPDRVTKLIKRADKIAAYYEATCLAGFSRSEARRFFGQPRGLSSALVNRLRHLSPLPAARGEAEFLKRFNELYQPRARAARAGG